MHNDDDARDPSPLTSTSTARRTSWRTGWTWTLIKCALATITSALLGTAGLVVALRALLAWLPGWLPNSWVEWLFAWALRHVWFIGPVVGVVVGALISTAIIAVDAKRGRLTRIR